MESSIGEENYTTDFIVMPWEDKTTLILSPSNDFVTPYNRWELIKQNLQSITPILNFESLVNVIKSYNVVIERNCTQTPCPWKFIVLQKYFSNLDSNEYSKFFQTGGVLSTIRNLALQLQDLVPRLQLLKTGFNLSITLHQLQIASLLANAFLCTFPRGRGDCPSINFNTLFESNSNSVINYNVEKIKCLMHYFYRLHQKQPTGILSFHRLCIPDHKFPRWDKTTVHLSPLVVDSEGKIEDQDGYLQMDFANKYVGGGVLSKGCVQEEIRFIICPELIVTRLFTERLAENEALFIVGAERYCRYTGYSNTFKFIGDYQDSTPYDEKGHKKTYIVAIDALYFHRSSEQFRESRILRELKKAYVGFKPLENTDPLPLATGNWGCGAFGGDPQLKSILQLMASSQARRKMLYLTFGDVVLKNQLEELYELLKEKSIHVGMLYRIIRLYYRERRKNQSVFEFVKEAIDKMEKRKLFKKLSKIQRISSNAFEFNIPSCDKVSLMEEAATQLLKTKIESNSEQNCEFSDMDINFDALDEDIRNQTIGVVQNKNSCQKAEAAGNSRSGCESTALDVIWYENETSGLKKKSEKQQEKQHQQEVEYKSDAPDSPSLFSDDDKMSEDQNSPLKNDKNRDRSDSPHLMDVSDSDQVLISPQKNKLSKEKKLLQKKITDCFFFKNKI